MILMGGMGLALGLGAHLLPLFAQAFRDFCTDAVGNQDDLLENWSLFWGKTHDHMRNTILYGFQFFTAVLFGITPAFLIVGFRRPHPPWRSLLAQPGTIAALGIVFGVLWVNGFLAMLFPDRYDSMTGASIAAGGTVAVAWTVLALSRKWRTGLGWVDFVGRLLGAAAIVNALLGFVVFRI
jgi:hypothetical protein